MRIKNNMNQNKISYQIDLNYFNDPSSHYCDFCAVKMDSVFNVLEDSREICSDCSASKLETKEKFIKIYELAKSKMEEFFGISFGDLHLEICDVDSETFNSLFEENLTTTSGFDPRNVALAIPEKSVIYVERNVSRIVALAHLVNELTNVWQYLHWNKQEINKVYGHEHELQIYEGMALWVEIQFMYFIGETGYARRQEIYYENCFSNISTSPYVLGLKEYLNHIPFISPFTLESFETTQTLQVTPFTLKLPIMSQLMYSIKNAHRCDFCNIPMFKGQYEVLHDEREQCNICKKTALCGVNEPLIKICYNVLTCMQLFFGIQIKDDILISVEDAREIARLRGKRFFPTSKYDNRELAFAEKYMNSYKISIEDRTPELNAIETIAHEITHIWQFSNWDKTIFENEYGKEDSEILYEGMAVWAEIQFLLFLNAPDEINQAKQSIESFLNREDKYGWGLYNYMKEYPFVDSPENMEKSPFNMKIRTKNNQPFPLQHPVEKPKRIEMLNLIENYIEQED